MNYISVNYTYKYEIDFAHWYKVTDKGIVYNSRTNRKLKQIYNNGCLGYFIKGKFYSLTKLRKHLIKPNQSKLDFF